MIEVTDKYGIDSDKNQWRVLTGFFNEKEQKKEWSPIAYYTTLEGAIECLSGMMLRTSEYNSLVQLMDNAREISELMDKKFPLIDG